jgi:hypothetical protein
MKKLILSVTALAACSVGAYAQGVIYFDTSSATAPAGQVTINGALDVSQDINAELLTSTSASGSFTPVAQLLLSSSNSSPDGTPGFDPSDILAAAGDITFSKTGFLTDQSGSFFVLSAAAGTTEYFEVEGWLGANESSLAAAEAAGFATGTSAVFAESLGASTSPIPSGLASMPGLALAVPEPSTLAMAGVGLASMLIFRRRNK